MASLHLTADFMSLDGAHNDGNARLVLENFQDGRASKAKPTCMGLNDPQYSQKRRLRNTLNPISFKVSNEHRNQRREFF